jgi:SAM-dependent methyltransferase
MYHFERSFKVKDGTKILDVGGTSYNWSFLKNEPSLIFVNLMAPSNEDNVLTWIIADGRCLPFCEDAFDIVYSNSVIEHLGNIKNQYAFAQEIKRVGRRYYVQTPNRWFFVEPHLITPFIHFLPKTMQNLLLRNFTIWGIITRPTPQQCNDLLSELRLLDEKEFRRLFPDAEIWFEHFLGLTKSLIAVNNMLD